MTTSPGLLQYPDGEGRPSREPGDEVRKESSDARREPMRDRRGHLDEDDGVIPDYVMRDFGSPEEAGEDPARDS